MSKVISRCKHFYEQKISMTEQVGNSQPVEMAEKTTYFCKRTDDKAR